MSESSSPAATDDARGRARVQRRTVRIIMGAQVLGGTGLAAGLTVGALLAKDLLGGDRLSGLPAALFTLGAGLASYLIGRLAQARGRRISLGAGFLVAALGAVGIVASAATRCVPALLLFLLLYGAGTASNLQARYAATDLADASQRGRALSRALVSTTVGAVAGPNLVGPLGSLAAGLGLPRLTGPFLLAALAYALAGLVLVSMLRPDPLLLARELSASSSAAGSQTAAAVDDPIGIRAGTAVMVLSQLTMVSIMTVTPVHMQHHHHDLAHVGLVISMHVGAMYLPSLVTGRLVDRVGAIAMACASSATLVCAGVFAAIAPGDSLAAMIGALALLGLGWNFGLIAGTTMLVTATSPATRARTQGTCDVLVSVAGAGGGVTAGFVAGATTYATLCLTAVVVALAVLIFLPRPRGVA